MDQANDAFKVPRLLATHNDALETQEFFELMQSYRHASIAEQDVTVEAFESVKTFIRKAITENSIEPIV